MVRKGLTLLSSRGTQMSPDLRVQLDPGKSQHLILLHLSGVDLTKWCNAATGPAHIHCTPSTGQKRQRGTTNPTLWLCRWGP